MTIDLSTLHYEKIIIKPWGKEIIHTPNNLKYTYKTIKINDGSQWSLQSHTQKVETFILISGKANLVVGDSLDNLKTFNMEINKSYNIPVGTIHRAIGIQNAVILEASTPETGTTIRYQDDYHRPDETEAIRKEKNRGWTPPSDIK